MNPSKEEIKARELIKRSCTVPDTSGKCYIPSDETMDMIIQAAIDEAYRRGRLDQHADQFQINKTMKIWSSSRPAQEMYPEAEAGLGPKSRPAQEWTTAPVPRSNGGVFEGVLYVVDENGKQYGSVNAEVAKAIVATHNESRPAQEGK